MKKSKLIAIHALALALMIVFTFLPTPGLPVRLAVLTLIPLIICSIITGWKGALFTSASMGVLSLLGSWISPVSPISYIFRNPLISVLPRLLIGFAVMGVYHGCRHLFKKRQIGAEVVSATAAGITAALVNTGLVFLMVYLCYYGKTVEGTSIGGEFFLGLLGINFVVEVIGSALLSAPLVIAVKKSLRIPVIRPIQKQAVTLQKLEAETERVLEKNQKEAGQKKG